MPRVASSEVRDASGFDFHEATAHTVYNKKLHLVRRAEITALRDWVIGAKSRPEKNAITIGDFNANPGGQPATPSLPSKSPSRAATSASGTSTTTPIGTLRTAIAPAALLPFLTTGPFGRRLCLGRRMRLEGEGEGRGGAHLSGFLRHAPRGPSPCRNAARKYPSKVTARQENAMPLCRISPARNTAHQRPFSALK